jgi:hypothetical protein
MNLAELAYAIGTAINCPLTVLDISGAIRGLGLKNDRSPRRTVSRGCVVFRQQTMVHTSQTHRLQQYIIARKGLI